MPDWKAITVGAALLFAYPTLAEVQVAAPSFVVGWDAASGPVAGYEVFVSPDCGQTWPAVPYARTGSDTETPLTEVAVNADWGVCWGIRVRAYATEEAITAGTESPGPFGEVELFRVGAEPISTPLRPTLLIECPVGSVVGTAPVEGEPNRARFLCVPE